MINEANASKEYLALKSMDTFSEVSGSSKNYCSIRNSKYGWSSFFIKRNCR